MRLYGIVKHSVIDGPGVRYVIFTQGCEHNCKGCHNPDSHKLDGGYYRSVTDIVNDIKSTKHIDGLTFSGGDPILQAPEVSQIVSEVKSLGLNIWLYTGYSFEELVDMTCFPLTTRIPVLSLLGDIDVLVDGPFIEDLSSDNPIYRGSSNQRLIDLKKSIETGKPVDIINLWR